jgi:DNA repair exonuclease SbcCD nuclease subunit
MRFLCTADIHGGEYNTGPVVDGINQRVPDIVRQFERMRNYALNNGIKHLFVLGDLFRTKHPSMLLLSVMSEIFYGFRECGITIWAITGNHDVYRMEGQTNALSVYKHMHVQGVHISDTPSIITVEGIKFLMFPYMGAPQDQLLKQAIADNPGADVLMMHGSVEGAVVNRHTDYEIHDADEIKFDTVSPFKLVVAGHLHHAHNLGHVWYPGSIERLTFDDEGVEKSFMDVEYTNGSAQVERVPLDARKMMTLSYEQIPEIVTGLLSVKDAVVRVIGVESEQYNDVQKILKDKGCYHIASMQRQVDEHNDIGPIEDIKMSDVEFVRVFAKKIGYQGDVERAAQVVAEALNG